MKEYKLTQDMLDRFYPNQWTDQQGTLTQAAAASGLLLEEIRDTPFRIYWFKHNQTERIDLSYQFDHRWDKTEVQPHIHILPSAATTGNVTLSGRYFWSAPNSGIAFPAWADWTPWTVTRAITAPENGTEVVFNLFTTTPPTLAAVDSASLWITVSRVSGGDTYTGSKAGGTAAANVGLLFLDAHRRDDSFGSLTPYGP